MVSQPNSLWRDVKLSEEHVAVSVLMWRRQVYLTNEPSSAYGVSVNISTSNGVSVIISASYGVSVIISTSYDVSVIISTS
jgi:hypothetical protein